MHEAAHGASPSVSCRWAEAWTPRSEPWQHPAGRARTRAVCGQGSAPRGVRPPECGERSGGLAATVETSNLGCDAILRLTNKLSVSGKLSLFGA